MLRKIILFLIRKKLGVKDGEYFQFAEQKSKLDHYFICGGGVYKWEWHSESETFALVPSKVSLNWLIDPTCEIKKFMPYKMD